MTTRSERNKKKHLERDKEEYKRKRNKRIKVTLLIVFILGSIITLLYLYARYLEPSLFVVNEVMLQDDELPDSFDGFKVIQFSDTHYGSTVDLAYLKKVVDEINIREPHLVVFTGDLVDKRINITLEEQQELVAVLSEIKATVGKYAVKGNHDYHEFDYDMLMSDAGFTVLNNSSDLIYYDGYNPILLTGLVSSIKDHPDINKAFNYHTLENSNPNIYTISLFHEPDTIDTILESYNVDLALAGHSHGGQIRLPFIGAIAKTDGARKYYDDYYKIGETDLFVSYGLGTSIYDLRFLNPPSINFYRLTK